MSDPEHSVDIFEIVKHMELDRICIPSRDVSKSADCHPKVLLTGDDDAKTKVDQRGTANS